ncbi:MAG TPA: hypothetical protein PLX89_06400, partial [Verrucomicrobiota bacterium]|nr:hypothetical protein [Verrucomicrobiota bacterium]
MLATPCRNLASIYWRALQSTLKVRPASGRPRKHFEIKDSARFDWQSQEQLLPFLLNPKSYA